MSHAAADVCANADFSYILTWQRKRPPSADTEGQHRAEAAFPSLGISANAVYHLPPALLTIMPLLETWTPLLQNSHKQAVGATEILVTYLLRYQLKFFK